MKMMLNAFSVLMSTWFIFASLSLSPCFGPLLSLCLSLSVSILFPTSLSPAVYIPGSFAWLGILCLVMQNAPVDRVSAAPICDNGQASCQVLSLADLFDRVIQHSARMHGISNDLHSQFVSFSLHALNKTVLKI